MVSEAPAAQELEILVSQSRTVTFRVWAPLPDLHGCRLRVPVRYVPGSFAPSFLASGEVSFLEVVLSRLEATCLPLNFFPTQFPSVLVNQ